MALNPNIDGAGRALRFGAGLMLLLSGAIGMYYGMPGAGFGWRLFQGALVLAGLFGLFEALFSWCAFRAMGIRTPV